MERCLNFHDFPLASMESKTPTFALLAVSVEFYCASNCSKLTPNLAKQWRVMVYYYLQIAERRVAKPPGTKNADSAIFLKNDHFLSFLDSMARV